MQKAGNFISRGCRLLDYAKPATHNIIPRGDYLLNLHAGALYDSQSCSDRNELLTIFYCLKRVPSFGAELVAKNKGNKPEVDNNVTSLPGNTSSKNTPPIWPVLKRRLKLPKDTQFEYTEPARNNELKRIRIWVDCVFAADIQKAMDIIRLNPVGWPPHMILYTFSRKCNSSIEASNALVLFEEVIPTLPKETKVELTYLLIRMLREWLVDLFPRVIEIFLKNINEDLSIQAANELIWRLAFYGRQLESVDITPIQNAQSLLVKKIGPLNLDAKGAFGICYVEHFREKSNPSRILQFMEKHCHINPTNSKEFAYTCGPQILRILTAPTAEHILSNIESLEHHKGAIYTCCMVTLARRGELSSELASKMFIIACKKKMLTAIIVELTISHLLYYEQKLRCLHHAQNMGIKLTPSIVASIARLKSLNDLNSFEQKYSHYIETNTRVFNKFLISLAKVDPSRFWSFYKTKYHNTDLRPSREVLISMCHASWNTNLMWEGMYASQRTTAEFKQHVRGVVSPSNDIYRIFPNNKLLYAYVVMLGRCQYFNELFNCLQWIDNLQIKVSKDVLLAILHYSPQGPALLKIGNTIKGWPTPEELKAYEQMFPKLDTF